jgi:hypothetical protein
MAILPEREYIARAVEFRLAETQGGKPQVAAIFEIEEGEHAGRRLAWFGHLTPDTEAHTIRALINMGWQGSRLDLVTLDQVANSVSIVVQHQEDQESRRLFARIRWVNKIRGLSAVKPLEEARAAELGATLEEAVRRARAEQR